MPSGQYVSDGRREDSKTGFTTGKLCVKPVSMTVASRRTGVIGDLGIVGTRIWPPIVALISIF